MGCVNNFIYIGDTELHFYYFKAQSVSRIHAGGGLAVTRSRQRRMTGKSYSYRGSAPIIRESQSVSNEWMLCSELSYYAVGVDWMIGYYPRLRVAPPALTLDLMGCVPRAACPMDRGEREGYDIGLGFLRVRSPVLCSPLAERLLPSLRTRGYGGLASSGVMVPEQGTARRLKQKEL